MPKHISQLNQFERDLIEATAPQVVEFFTNDQVPQGGMTMLPNGALVVNPQDEDHLRSEIALKGMQARKLFLVRVQR